MEDMIFERQALRRQRELITMNLIFSDLSFWSGKKLFVFSVSFNILSSPPVQLLPMFTFENVRSKGV